MWEPSHPTGREVRETRVVLTLTDALEGATGEIKQLLLDADARGWYVGRVTSDLRMRMHCPCSRRHNMWFNARPDTPGYAERHRLLLAQRSCWEEGDSE